MAMITNIEHFLDEKGQVPDMPLEAQELLRFPAAIIETASLGYDRPIILSDIPCRKTVGGTPCPGEIEVWVYAENNQIGWECLECGEEGIITHWEGTPWDKRNYTRH